MKRKIFKNIYILYKNELEESNQEHDKPATILFDGYIVFRKNSKLDRKGKPSVICFDGSLQYFEEIKL